MNNKHFLNRLSLVTLANDIMPPLSNKSSGISHYSIGKQTKELLERKKDTERAEPVKDYFGNTSVIKLNADTHSKIVLSNDVIGKLIEFNQYYGDPYTIESWDQIMLRILSIANSNKRKRTD